MKQTPEPQLAPPGAGLPAVELLLGRLIFAFRRWRGSREVFNARFESERRMIAGLIQKCDAESTARRVLIERCRGMEDSSRYWSVWMTLDHLRIVNLQISQIIEALAKGITPVGQASTANVKPNRSVTASVVDDYETACDKLLKTVDSVDNLRTAARYTHPWFGPLDAFGWHALAGGHMGIHRVQLERIIDGLGASGKQSGANTRIKEQAETRLRV
jgi:hypothetical protein